MSNSFKSRTLVWAILLNDETLHLWEVNLLLIKYLAQTGKNEDANLLNLNVYPLSQWILDHILCQTCYSVHSKPNKYHCIKEASAGIGFR